MYIINKKYNFVSKNLLNRVNFKYGRTKGKISIRHKGGGIKYLYSNIDFKYLNYNSSLAIILKFYIDFNRTSIISVILFINGYLKGSKKLIISTLGLNIGDIISFDSKFPLKLGSIRYINNFFVGMYLHSVECFPKKGISIARALGTKIKIIYYINNYVCVKMPSGQFKLLNNKCLATLGQNSILCKNKKFYKAGSMRIKNIRPTVRGVVMNAIDHPHGGGCGRSSVGLKSSKTPWGKFNYGIKTKKFDKLNKFIIYKNI